MPLFDKVCGEITKIYSFTSRFLFPSFHDLRGVVDMLWALALTVENDRVSQSANDLRAAEQALREAMAARAASFVKNVAANPSSPSYQS